MNKVNSKFNLDDIDFSIEEFVVSAEKLGMEIEVGSDTPGMFFTVDGNEIELTFGELFPEVFKHSKGAILDIGEFTVRSETIENHVLIPAKKVFKVKNENGNELGAA